MSKRMRSKGIAYVAFSLGSLLSLIPAIGFLGGISSIVAFVLLFLVLFGLASEYGDAKLKSLATQYVFLAVAYAVFIVIFAVLLGPEIESLTSSGGRVEASQLLDLLSQNASRNLLLYLPFAAAVVYGGYLFFRYWSIVAEKTGVSHFRTAGVLYLASPILAVTVVLAVVAPIVGLLANIFLLVAFLKVNVREEAPAS